LELNLVDFNNNIIVITGSTSGISRSCSFAFGKLGTKIALIGRNDDKFSKNLKE
jgi:NADP-dependent 3-hydroxy acid dehydrogenase YdfG